MDSVYTTTLTTEALKRGISIKVIDSETPIFEMSFGGKKIRCYNGLTDKVGAVSFILANNKVLANRFLSANGIRTPAQIKYTGQKDAMRFLKRWRRIVVKPATEWGGRGVSVAVRTPDDLASALKRARRFGEEVLLEQYVQGVDKRLIYVDRSFVAAIMRTPAFVSGNGRDSLRKLIKVKNREMRRVDPSHKIPIDSETKRSLTHFGHTLESVPARGKRVQVRLTSNYHTGGDCVEITDSVEKHLVAAGEKIVRLLAVPLLGIDFLVVPGTKKYWVIETSPDAAISPPEGGKVANMLLNSLFPDNSCLYP